jgi:hypothetical protein
MFFLCKKQGVQLPMDEAARAVDEHATGEALNQAVTKRRDQFKSQGYSFAHEKNSPKSRAGRRRSHENGNDTQNPTPPVTPSKSSQARNEKMSVPRSPISLRKRPHKQLILSDDEGSDSAILAQAENGAIKREPDSEFLPDIKDEDSDPDFEPSQSPLAKKKASLKKINTKITASKVVKLVTGPKIPNKAKKPKNEDSPPPATPSHPRNRNNTSGIGATGPPRRLSWENMSFESRRSFIQDFTDYMRQNPSDQATMAGLGSLAFGSHATNNAGAPGGNGIDITNMSGHGTNDISAIGGNGFGGPSSSAPYMAGTGVTAPPMQATYSVPVMPITGYAQSPNMMHDMPNAAGYGYGHGYGYGGFGGLSQPMDDITYGYYDRVNGTAANINSFVGNSANSVNNGQTGKYYSYLLEDATANIDFY